MTIDKGNSAPDVGGPPASARGPASPIEFRLDRASGLPTYLQLVQQVEHALRLGYLQPGDQLPKVRDVVTLLTINPNTVLKAYRELENKGLVAGRPGQGTFIQATLSQVALPELAVLRRPLLGWLASADTAGLDEDGIVALFTSVLRDFLKRRGGSGDWPGSWRPAPTGTPGRRASAGHGGRSPSSRCSPSRSPLWPGRSARCSSGSSSRSWRRRA